MSALGSLLAAALAAAALAAAGHSREARVRPLTPLRLETVRQHAVAASNTDQPVALVLGGGGLRGFAHIGVLRALEEHGIRPDIVVGTSAGALVGAAYASGATVEQLEAAATSIDVPALIDLTLDEGGLMRGDEIARWVDGATQGRRIEDFPIRFGAVATDLESGDAVVLAAGAPGDAVRASAAVPGATVPVVYPGGSLVDGGVSSLVPVRFARAMGARAVIAVDIYCNDGEPMTLSAAGVLRRSMHLQTCQLADPELSEADIVIRATVPMPKMSEASSRQKAMDAGYEAASATLEKHGSASYPRASLDFQG
ncbi:patatin-like phospholipase family protein [Stenotrophomonas sp. AB1(2024)]|uniref:patatin-like phospholipase family protein n=1 Tax=Stenotrophomonas sp. AB1(2024) TaxID=3132215 RepID=UPI0030ACCB93